MMMWACVPLPVPGDADSGVVAVRAELHGGLWAVFAKVAEITEELGFQAVSPEDELGGLDRVDPELGAVAGARPLGPDVAEQAVGEHAELVRFAGFDRQVNPLGSKAGFRQGDATGARGEIGVDRPEVLERASTDPSLASSNSRSTLGRST